MLLKNFVAAYQSLKEACAILGFLTEFVATGQLAQWPPSNTTWFVSFATTMGQLAQWLPRNTTWFVCFETTTGQLAQWPPSNTTWFVCFETTRY